jgi:predicted metal-dependent enzyme (double-stranded beta helix superfamily)
MFDVDQFIADLRATLGERSRKAMRDVVAHAVSDPASVVRTLGEPDKPGINILHKSPELTVLTLAWTPMQVTLPHNHRMSAVIGMYGGREDNTFWRRAKTGSKFAIEPAGGESLGTGDVTLLGPDIVHSVVNPLGKISAAIHVYDGPFLTAERSMWDAEKLQELPYDINAVAKGMSPAKN